MEEHDEMRELGNEEIHKLNSQNVHLTEEVQYYKKEKTILEENIHQERKNRALLKIKFESFQKKYDSSIEIKNNDSLQKFYQDQIHEANEIIELYRNDLKDYQRKISELSDKIRNLEQYRDNTYENTQKSQGFQKSKNWKMKMINSVLVSYEKINFIRNDISEDIIRWFKDTNSLYTALQKLNCSKEINKISGYKSIQGKRGWYETHINEGESNRGRIYVRFDPSTMKFDVDIGYKKNDKSQSRQIASLPVSV